MMQMTILQNPGLRLIAAFSIFINFPQYLSERLWLWQINCGYIWLELGKKLDPMAIAI